MKSTEVYKEISKFIFPNLQSKGFKKNKSGMLGFYKQLKELYLVIWFQCSRDGFDQFAGSKFIIEIQISETNEIGTASVVRHRIPFFLTDKDFDNITKIENEIKDKLQKPPKTYFIFNLADDIQNWYKKKFEKTTNKYNNESDIWFVYSDHADIEKWTKLIEPMINKIIYDFEQTEY
jgi:hypothetical protein